VSGFQVFVARTADILAFAGNVLGMGGGVAFAADFYATVIGGHTGFCLSWLGFLAWRWAWLFAFPAGAHCFGGVADETTKCAFIFIQDTAGDYFPQQGGFDLGLSLRLSWALSLA
jgi:hypothetical protein